jgi:DnaJ-class molecular chaperone
MRAFMSVMVVIAAGCDSPRQISASMDADITAELACDASLSLLAESKPAPDVSDKCDNCNGTGKIGDGKIVMQCPECGGTGKKKK